MGITPATPQERLVELFAKVEAFFDQAKLRHGDALTCHAGCDDCCQKQFSVTSLEAAIVQEALDAMPDSKRRILHERSLRQGPTEPCPALGESGLCEIYEARPLICRTHGLPIRFVEENENEGKRSLPVVASFVDACPKNFKGQDLGALNPRDVLDQKTLSTVLGGLDAAFADSVGLRRGGRFEMVELCRIDSEEEEESAS